LVGVAAIFGGSDLVRELVTQDTRNLRET